MKIVKWALGILLSILTIVFIIGFLVNEKEPYNMSSREADSLAKKMLESLDYEAWDSTRYVQWNFMNRNKYFWDKTTNLVRIESDDLITVINTQNQAGKAIRQGKHLTGKQLDKALEIAWVNFCNDGFWFYAPFKAFDPGTSRSIVQVKDGRKGLKVKYDSGGVTPGDAFVWFLDENHIPTSYKIWVKVIPLGGLEFQWTDWKSYETGVKLAGKRSIKNMTITLSDIRTGMDLTDFGFDGDPFTL